MTPAQILAHTAEQKRLWDALSDGFIAQVDQIAARHKFGRCGESAGSEDKGSNEQRPIQLSCTAEHKPTIPELGGCYGSEEPTADDGEEGYLDEEPYWSDSDTARELQESRGKAK